MAVAIFTLISVFVIGYALCALLKAGRKSVGGSATMMLGATDLMLNEDKKRAAKEIVQQQAGEIRLMSENDQGEVCKKKDKKIRR